MQTIDNNAAIVADAVASIVPASDIAPVADTSTVQPDASTEAVKPVTTSKPKRVRNVKPVSTDAKPSAPVAAKPSVAVAPVAAVPAGPDISAERRAAALAVGAFYTAGPSFPFKSASVKLSPINFDNVKNPSTRTAALIAAMLAYSGDNIKANGTFVRGGFRVPARLINPSAKPGEMLAAMPESGCIGNMLGRVVHHVSGPLGGKQARDGVFRLDFAKARAELQLLGDAVAKPALAVLNRLAPVKPVAAKPAKAA